MIRTNKQYRLLLLPFVVLGLTFVFGSRASAATINVVSGTDDIAANGQCQLSEAIININDQAQTYTDCAAGDGNNDTIVLPAGTITLSDNLPGISQSVTIQGQGMGNSIIDGNNGQWRVINASAGSSMNYSFTSFTIRAFNSTGLVTSNGNASIENIEVDGTDALFTGSGSPVGILNDSAIDNTVSIANLYVHDLIINNGALNAVGVGTGGAATTSLTAQNITITDVTNTDPAGAINSFLIAVGLFGGAPGTHGVTGSVSNYTATNIHSAGSVNAIAVLGAAIGTSNTETDITLNNATFTDISSPNSYAGVLGAGGAGFQQGDVGFARLRVANVILAGNSIATGCDTLDLTSIFGGQGSGSGEIVSLGGNLSSDNTCSSYLTHATDQNNVTNLSSFFAPLANNGGYVPTLALLEGSPAIDSGVTVSGLTTDARLAARPQGSGFDSGAYESPYTKPAPTLAASGSNITIPLVTIGAIVTSLGLLLTRRQALAL